jgi:hypothetical protein
MGCSDFHLHSNVRVLGNVRGINIAMINKLFIIISCILATSFFVVADDENLTLKAVESFQGYCFATDANFVQIEKLISVLQLKQLPDNYAAALGGPDAKKTKLYWIEESHDKKAIFLGFSQPDACSIRIQNVDFLPIKKLMMEHFKLVHCFTDDVGLQINEMYVPGGISGSKIEAKKYGLIAFMYPKPSMGHSGGTISYIPPETAKYILNSQ